MFIFLYLAFFKDESKIEAKKKIALKNQNVINLKEITKATDPLSKNKSDENGVGKIIDKVNEKINEITETQNKNKSIENSNDVDNEMYKENTEQPQEVVDNEMNKKDDDEKDLNIDEDVMMEGDETKEIFKEDEVWGQDSINYYSKFKKSSVKRRNQRPMSWSVESSTVIERNESDSASHRRYSSQQPYYYSRSSDSLSKNKKGVTYPSHWIENLARLNVWAVVPAMSVAMAAYCVVLVYID